jgi:uncharacterized protein YndB with AHSA1/START domain
MATKKSTLTLPSDTQVQTVREFDAPRELVFQAHTDPKLVEKWWGQRTTKTTVDKLDLRVGGQWRFVQRSDSGEEYAFRGEYREIVPPERLVNTFEFEGMPGHIVVDAMVLEEIAPGKTRMTTTSTFSSKEDRDGMLASGMEDGASESWAQLDELLAERQKA